MGKTEEVEKFILDKNNVEPELEKTSHTRQKVPKKLNDFLCLFYCFFFSILTLIRHYPIGRRNFFLITFNWLANAMVYNGLSYYSANLNVSSHLGFFIRWRLKTHDGRVNYYMFTFQLSCGGAILLYWVVLHGQVGSQVDFVRDHDDRRTVLHLLHLCPRG